LGAPCATGAPVWPLLSWLAPQAANNSAEAKTKARDLNGLLHKLMALI
jgi:hypothetical protein